MQPTRQLSRTIASSPGRSARTAQAVAAGVATRALALFATAALALGATACGAKPKPKPSAATTSATRPNEPSSAGPEAPVAPPERTRGGVELAAALESAGPAREQVFAAAQVLSKDRPAGVARLLAAKAAAKATVLALLESNNLDELIGAMLVLGSDGDPTGARAEGTPGVFALLDHEVGAVRDIAWETAGKVADGAALATLLPTLPPERKLAVVRLLAAWDGEPVQAALWDLIGGADAELAIEAALALSAPGKRAGPLVTERLQTLTADSSDAHLRLALIVNRRFPVEPKAKVSPALKAAIDRALAAKDEALVLEGVRSTMLFAPDERTPLLEQLALDPRTAVRAVTAEVLARHAAADAPSPLKAGDGARAIAVLDKLLADPEGDVRMAAASARSRVGARDGRVAALTTALLDANRGVRLAAAVSMAQPELVDACGELLTKQLAREDDEGRKTILGALTRGASRVGLGIVIELLIGHDSDRVIAAHFALTTATKQDFGTDVGAWKAWLDARYPPPAPPAEATPDKPTAAPAAASPKTAPTPPKAP